MGSYRILKLHIGYLKIYSELLREQLDAENKVKLPPDAELKTTDFQKNEIYISLYDFIRKRMKKKYFHPKNLYEYIFEPLRKHEQKSLDDIVLVEIPFKGKSGFPDALFKLLDYKGIFDFIENAESEKYSDIHLSPEAVELQDKIIKTFQNEGAGEKFRLAYNCYISNLNGKKYKKAILGIRFDNSINFRFSEDTKKEYHGQLNSNKERTVFYLYDTESKVKEPPTVSITLLNGDGIGEHIFHFGTFSGVNNNDHLKSLPALTRGVIILELIDPNLIVEKNCSEVLSLLPPELETSIAILLCGQREELKMGVTRKSRKKLFKEKRTEELEFISDSTAKIVMEQTGIVGEYLLLIYSKQNEAIRKLIFFIHPDLNITAKAKKYSDGSSDDLTYSGNVIFCKENNLRLSAKKKYPSIDYFEGVFRYQSMLKPMLGHLSGIFKKEPKTGLAIFIKKNAELEAITSFDKPGLIKWDSEEFKKLDNFLSISEFFAGKSYDDKGMLSQKIMNDHRELFTRLLNRKNGDFKDLYGLYEEFYYDADADIIRKDFIQINEDGSAFMLGCKQYFGIVDNYSIFFNIHFKPYRWGFPVDYRFHFEAKSNELFSGVRSSITNDNRRIESQMVILKLKDKNCISEDKFFRQRCDDIQVSSERFRELNESNNNIGLLLIKNADRNSEVISLKDIYSDQSTRPLYPSKNLGEEKKTS